MTAGWLQWLPMDLTNQNSSPYSCIWGVCLLDDCRWLQDDCWLAVLVNLEKIDDCQMTAMTANGLKKSNLFPYYRRWCVWLLDDCRLTARGRCPYYSCTSVGDCRMTAGRLLPIRESLPDGCSSSSIFSSLSIVLNDKNTTYYDYIQTPYGTTPALQCWKLAGGHTPRRTPSFSSKLLKNPNGVRVTAGFQCLWILKKWMTARWLPDDCNDCQWT